MHFRNVWITAKNELDKRRLARPHDFLQSRSCHRQLKGLYDELHAAAETLDLALSLANLNNTADLQYFVRQEAVQIK